jgi:hypothetical protein
MLWKHISVFLTLARCCPVFHNPGQIFVLGGGGWLWGNFLPPYVFKFYALNWSQNTLPNGFSNFQYKNERKVSKKLKKLVEFTIEKQVSKISQFFCWKNTDCQQSSVVAWVAWVVFDTPSSVIVCPIKFPIWTCVSRQLPLCNHVKTLGLYWFLKTLKIILKFEIGLSRDMVFGTMLCYGRLRHSPMVLFLIDSVVFTELVGN